MTDALPKLPCRYEGEGVFTAATPHWRRIGDKHFVVGAVYDLQHEEARSDRSHKHQFAEIHDAWRNLPEHLAERFPTSEALRKHALIRAGFATVTEHVTGSHAEALRLAAVIASLDPYSVTEVRRNVVRHLRAMSQSRKAMGGPEFQRSKTATLDIVAEMIGVAPAALAENAARAAA